MYHALTFSIILLAFVLSLCVWGTTNMWLVCVYIALIDLWIYNLDIDVYTKFLRQIVFAIVRLILAHIGNKVSLFTRVSITSEGLASSPVQKQGSTIGVINLEKKKLTT
ncbi:hypothetical protein ACJX0J_026546 [Zea mays]